MPEEPPFITFRSPYGGFGLKTKSAQASRARIEGLLTSAVEVELGDLELMLTVACSREVAPATLEAFAARGYTVDEPSREAWAAFGAPERVTIGAPNERGDTFVAAAWSCAASAYQRCCTFLERWQALPCNDYVDGVTLRASWLFRLASTSGAIAAPPFPPSRILAHLRRRHASAFLDLVFPYDAPTPDFIADYGRFATRSGCACRSRRYGSARRSHASATAGAS